MKPPTLPWSIPELAARAGQYLRQGERHLLGLTGAPGAGKSTMAVALCEALGPTVARVPMDGFHLANQVLRGLGIADRKGSPASFDVGGFHALLKRLRSNDEQIVYAPEFYREFEESIAGALPIANRIELVIVEGNYLLLEEGQWQHTAALLDEVWYLSPPETVRQTRLVRRHQANGRTLEAARAWITGNDDPNAQVVATTANRANAIIVADPKRAESPQ